jgi:hypothetical protein
MDRAACDACRSALRKRREGSRACIACASYAPCDPCGYPDRPMDPNAGTAEDYSLDHPARACHYKSKELRLERKLVDSSFYLLLLLLEILP